MSNKHPQRTHSFPDCFCIPLRMTPWASHRKRKHQSDVAELGFDSLVPHLSALHFLTFIKSSCSSANAPLRQGSGAFPEFSYLVLPAIVAWKPRNRGTAPISCSPSCLSPSNCMLTVLKHNISWVSPGLDSPPQSKTDSMKADLLALHRCESKWCLSF